MTTKQAQKESFPRDTTLHAELLSVADDDVVEMTNLTAKQTGIEGIVFISTTLGAHGPRVKYFLKAGGYQPSFSVSVAAEPRVLANSLTERVVNKMAPAVIAWVKLNRLALLKLWSEGTALTHDEFNAFVADLKKLPGK